MSATIDNRVVEMRFDNQQFERNATTSISTLEKLKNALKLPGSSKAFDNLNSSTSKLSLGGLGAAVENIGSKFSALETIGVGALLRIGQQAVDTGERLIKSLTIDQVTAGFDKYAEKTSAVQTIMAATDKHFDDVGVQMEYVSGQLEKLNWFTDETSFSFLDMVNNIGKFTSNNVQLDTAVTAMQGISTWAALSGANVQEAGRAMYNLSQAIATGAVKLIDWKSIENANMATAEFKETVMETAVEMGTLTRNADGTFSTLKGNEVTIEKFNQNLSDAWFSSEVLLKSLERYGGFTDELYELSDATGLTATQLLSAIDEFKSGQLDLNDLSKETGMSVDELSAKFKELASDEYDLGRRAFQAAQEAKTFQEAIDATKDAVSTGWMNTFELIFGNYQEAKKLWTGVANALWDLFASSAEARNEMLAEWKEMGGRDDLFKGLAEAFRNLLLIMAPVKAAFRDIFPAMTAERLVELTHNFRLFMEQIRPSEKTLNNLYSVFRGLFSVFSTAGYLIGQVFSALSPVNSKLLEFGSYILDSAAKLGDWIFELSNSIKETNNLKGILEPFVSFIISVPNRISSAFSSISDKGLFGGIWKAISDFFNNFRIQSSSFDSIVTFLKNAVLSLPKAFKTVFDYLGGFGGILSKGLLAGILLTVKKIADSLLNGPGSLLGIVDGIKGALDSLSGAFDAFAVSINVKSILKIAIAIGILTAALYALSQIPVQGLSAGLGVITVLFGELFGMILLLEKTLDAKKLYSINKVSNAMIGMSVAVLLLASAMKKISDLEIDELATGIVGVTVLIGELVAASILLSKFGGKIKSSALGMVLFAAAINILVSAVKQLGVVPFDEIKRGLIGVGAIMLEVAAFMFLAKFGDFGVGKALGIIGLSAALLILAKAVDAFGHIDANVFRQGAAAMAIILAEIAGFVLLSGNASHVLSTAIALIGIAEAIKVLQVALNTLGSMSIGELAKGIISMGLSLGIIVFAMKGLEGALPGAAALMIIATALRIFVPVVQSLGELSLGELAKGLISLAAAIFIIGVGAALFAPIVPAMLGLGAALALIGVSVGIASAGIALLTVALSGLALAGPAVTTAIVAMLPLIIRSIGEGLIEVVRLISSNITVIAKAFKDIITAVVDAIVSSIPKVVDGMLKLLSALLDSILKYLPNIVSTGMKIVQGLLEGIAANIQGVVNAAVDVVINFINGISSRIGDIIQAGIDLMLAFINGIADGIRNNTDKAIDAAENLIDALISAALTVMTRLPGDLAEKVSEAVSAIRDKVSEFADVGRDLIGGLLSGIGERVGAIKDKAIEVGGSFLNSLRDKVRSHSDSKETIDIGEDLGNGLVTGSDNKIGDVEKAADRIGGSYVNTLEDKLEGVNDIVDAFNSNTFNTSKSTNSLTESFSDASEAAQRLQGNVSSTKEEFSDANEAALRLKTGADDTSKSMKGLGRSAGGGSKRSSGSAASGMAEATKEAKKLFNVMEDGSDVIKAFNKNFSGFDAAESVTKLAEHIYSLSGSAAEEAAKSTEDRLAEMREAFIKYKDDLTSTISGQINLYGKFEKKAADVSGKVWLKNLNSQSAYVKAWADDMRKLVTRGISESSFKILADMGPQMRYQIKELLIMADDEFKELDKMIQNRGELVENTTADILASYSATVSGITEANKAVEESTNEAYTGLAENIIAFGNTHESVVQEIIYFNGQMADSVGNMAMFTEQAIEKAAYEYEVLRDAVTEAVSAQLDIFSAFNDESELSGDELISNMNSQVTGTRNWANNLNTLLARGLNEGLYKKLAEMGPKSYEYVGAFLDMTADQLSEANRLFEESLRLPEEIGMQLGNDFAVAGLMASAGYESGFNTNAGVEQARQMAQNTLSELRKTLDINSPSRETFGIGLRVPEGYRDGIIAKIAEAVKAVVNLANQSLTSLRNSTSESSTKSIGLNIPSGVASGIRAGASEAINAAARMARQALEAAKNELEIESPSKAFAWLGMQSDRGLAKGLLDNSREVDESATYVADSAIESMKTVIGHIADIINGEIDLDPTIRPVLDLTDLRAGAVGMNGIFGKTSYSLASGMRIQNGRESLQEMVNGAVQTTLAARGVGTGGAPIVMNVYGAQGQDEAELAEIVEQRLVAKINRLGAVWSI